MVHVQPYLLIVEEVEAIVRRIQDQIDRLNKANEETKKLLDQIAAQKEELMKEKAFLEKWIAMMKLMISSSIVAAVGALVMSIYLNRRKQH